MRARLIAAGLTTAALLVVGLVPVRADSGPEERKQLVDRRLAVAQAELQESSRRLAAATAAYTAAEAQLPAARAALAAVEGQLFAARAREAELRQRLAEVTAAEQAAEHALRRVVDEIAATRTETGNFARAAYRSGPLAGLGLMGSALEADSPTEFVERLEYARAIVRSQNTTLDRLRGQRAELAAKEAELAAHRRAVEQQRAAASQQVARTQELAARARAAEQRVEALVAQRQQALRVAEAERAIDLAFYREMRAEQLRLAAQVRGLMAREARGVSGSSQRDGWLSRPVPGPITSPYGMRFHPVLHEWRLHTGTDFGVPMGTEVRAAAGGRVLWAGQSRGYGYRVVVSHGYVGGRYVVTTYSHLSQLLVHAGERVTRGETLARSGDTGWSTGPHLHFEVMVDGEFVNPLGWL
ncbi:hypothetical protein TH66_11175 [Carbonactinospora thermoautotrophica]|nr:M23 family metallopeptidase [Carbonactinospora thermoautotrophica]KWX03460.1 hypothetical protein TH66_11175 [Carbonactinospora thermoautotrophica]